MIRPSCRMLASSLLLTNVDSHKREPSRERLWMDLSPSIPRLVKGLTWPTMDTIQTKSGGSRDNGKFDQMTIFALHFTLG